MAKAISKEWVEAYFQYGVDVTNRRIFFHDDVDADTIGYIIQGIYLMDSKSKDQDITLFVSSFGGDEYAMFALYDVLQTITCDVETVAMGKAMSAAPLLVAAGTPGKRWAMPHCYFMIHQSWFDDGEFDGNTVDKIDKTIAHYKDMASSWSKLMAKHTNKPASYWTAQCKKNYDVYFNAEMAVELGIVDALWDERRGHDGDE